ncbi:hypothetical protein J2X68_007624 [Streptomyces sp. 3330]|nr:hypothetical protein [Streptomyces sp. 3330]
MHARLTRGRQVRETFPLAAYERREYELRDREPTKLLR